jgi:hypothetical protein
MIWIPVLNTQMKLPVICWLHEKSFNQKINHVYLEISFFFQSLIKSLALYQMLKAKWINKQIEILFKISYLLNCFLVDQPYLMSENLSALCFFKYQAYRNSWISHQFLFCWLSLTLQTCTETELETELRRTQKESDWLQWICTV